MCSGLFAATATLAVFFGAVARRVAVTALATATSMGGLKLLGRSLADFENLSVEHNVFSGQGVIEVHDDFFGCDLDDAAHHAIALGGHHRHGVSGLNHLLVKFSVDDEDVAFEVYDMFGVAVAKGFGGFDGDVERIAGLETFDGFCEGLDKTLGDAEDEFFGVSGICLVDKCLGAVGGDFVQVITKGNKLAG